MSSSFLLMEQVNPHWETAVPETKIDLGAIKFANFNNWLLPYPGSPTNRQCDVDLSPLQPPTKESSIPALTIS